MADSLGFGLLRPLRRDGQSDFLADGGEAAVRSSVGQILGTIGASELTPGELPWRPDFGSLLHRLRNLRNDAVLSDLARVDVVDALARWEPRVIVADVEIAQAMQDGANVLLIRLRYDITSTASGNAVAVRSVDQTVAVSMG